MAASSLSSQDSIRKAPTGIDGFDDISHGGLPRGRTTLVTGGPGTGKTLFALQTLVMGVQQYDEAGIFVAFEENGAQIIEDAAGFDWNIRELVDHGLYLIDARLSSDVINTGAFDLSGLLAGLLSKAQQVGARRIVFDSIDVLLTILDNPVAERQELYRIHDWLSENDFTGMITARVGIPGDRQTFLQFMSDCVVILESFLVERAVLREIHIMKYRGSAYEQNAFPFAILPAGLEVASFSTQPMATFPLSMERVSTGISRLDTMLEGGYYRGSGILVTGSSGTTKTTLAVTFIEAACRRGESSLYVAFDESPREIVRNLKSVGIDLEPFINAGVLVMVSAQSKQRSADTHMVIVRDLLRRHGTQNLVIDPISSIVTSGGVMAAHSAVTRLMSFCKAEGITFMCTSLMTGTAQETETSRIHISTLADTWIHLSYKIQGGERNRALSVIKSRGTAHSNQVRELVVSNTGITLTDVYIAQGEVLMGALRMQKEEEERLEQERSRAATEMKKRELESSQRELEAKIHSLQQELEVNRSEFDFVSRQHELKEQEWESRERALREIRGAGDKDTNQGNP